MRLLTSGRLRATALTAVVATDTLADFGRGFELPREWLRQGVTRKQVAAGLRPLLELPVELVERVLS